MPHWCSCHIGADSSYWSSLEEKSCPSRRLQWMAREGVLRNHTQQLCHLTLYSLRSVCLCTGIWWEPHISFNFLTMVIAVSPIERWFCLYFWEKSGSCSGFYWLFLPRKPLHEHACVCSSQLLEEWTWEGFILPSGSRKVVFHGGESNSSAREAWKQELKTHIFTCTQ